VVQNMFVVLRSCVVMKSRGPSFGETVGFSYLARDLGGGHDGAWAQNEVRSLSSGFAQPSPAQASGAAKVGEERRRPVDSEKDFDP
jgi:hypothetical protein